MRGLWVYGLLIGLQGCKSTAIDSRGLSHPVDVMPSPASEETKSVSLGSGECLAPAFIEGKFYALGSQVVHQGRLYRAVHESNAGYDPLIWAWFWLPEKNCIAPKSIQKE